MRDGGTTRVFVGLLALFASGCGGSIDGGGEAGAVTEAYSGPPCNGHRDLCTRSLADVAFPGTHNAFSTEDSFTKGFSNQNRDIARQLADGIRGLMLDTYWHKPLFRSARAALCHGNCTAGGYIDLVPELKKIRTYLDQNPNEVIQLFIEQHSLSPSAFATALSQAGLLDEAYAHPSPTSPWPKLVDLITTRKRLVVFYWTDGQELPRPAFYHRIREEYYETPYKYERIDQFSCVKERGTPGAQLYLLNHFLSKPAGWEALAREANPWDVISARVRDCEKVQLPNAIVVDFYEQDEDPSDGIASVVRAARYLNGIP